MGDAVLSPHGVKEEECISASLDLWSGVEVETAYDQVYWQIYHPDAPMEKSANTINFRLATVVNFMSRNIWKPKTPMEKKLMLKLPPTLNYIP